MWACTTCGLRVDLAEGCLGCGDACTGLRTVPSGVECAYCDKVVSPDSGHECETMRHALAHAKGRPPPSYRDGLVVVQSGEG